MKDPWNTLRNSLNLKNIPERVSSSSRIPSFRDFHGVRMFRIRRDTVIFRASSDFLSLCCRQKKIKFLREIKKTLIRWYASSKINHHFSSPRFPFFSTSSSVIDQNHRISPIIFDSDKFEFRTSTSVNFSSMREERDSALPELDSFNSRGSYTCSTRGIRCICYSR